MVEPAHIAMPAWTTTLGDEVAAVCELAGFAPDPEQKLGLDATFALNEHGKSACSTFCLLCCRQNMKTGEIKQTELGWLFVTDERLVIHTAHLFDTAREAYRDLKEIIDGSSFLRKRIKRMMDTPADMSIETITGSRLVFKTRTKGGGVGKSPRKIILDEGYALHPEHISALRYSLSAQPDPQIVVASSACHEDSDVLRGFVTRGRAGEDPRLAYLEWCSRPPSEACRDGEACTHVYGQAVGCALDDPAEIRAANPLIGRRLLWQTIDDERRETITVELAAKHGRERAGWHDDPVEGLVQIDPKAWEDAGDRASELLDPIALGFDVQPGNLSASISALGKLKLSAEVIARALELGIEDLYTGPGRWRAEITGRGDDDLDSRPGTDWLVPRLAEIAKRAQPVALVYTPDGPAGAFRQALLDYRHDPEDPRSTQFVEVADDEDAPHGKTRLVALAGRQYQQACGALDADIRNDRFRHYDQTPLNEAVAGAHAQDVGDAWKWSRRDSSVNIAPLIAATCARHGFAVYGTRQTKPVPWAATL